MIGAKRRQPTSSLHDSIPTQEDKPRLQNPQSRGKSDSKKIAALDSWTQNKQTLRKGQRRIQNRMNPEPQIYKLGNG